ncbi:ATP-binding protein [Methylibium sp.]|uniref:ATP-binding protein n=1 Tax=Methylibium sp. TaxID=2067992 RepID=UPI003D115684
MSELGALIRQLQSRFVRSAEPHRVFDALLPELLRLGQSEYGFIAEVWRDTDGGPYLKIFTLSNIAWDADSRAMVERERISGMEFHNLQTLFGAALVTEEPVIANDAPNDPRSGGGLPPGHTALNTFLGVPLHYGSELVGMIGLANRQPGYDEALLTQLDPLFQSMAGIIASVQIDRQRRAAESALRVSEERWRRSFEMAGAGIAQTASDGRLLEVNARFCDIVGRPRQQLLSMRFQELTHPDDIAADEDLLRRLVAGALPHEGGASHEKRYLRPDGSILWVQIIASAAFDAQGRFLHAVTVVLDIDQRRHAQVALQEREALFTKLADRVPGVLLQFNVDTQGIARVPYASRGLRELFELEPDGAVRNDARLMIERVAKGQRKRVWETLERAGQELTAWSIEFEVDLPVRGRRWVEAHGSPERLPDGSTTWHGYISDITERKCADAALVSAQAAARANEAKTEFLSRMSHELRTPLNAVLGFTQLLLGDPQAPLQDGQRARLGHIERAGQHLLAMIGDVLDLSRIETGSLLLTLQAISVRALVDESFALVLPTARAGGVTLLQRASGNLQVQADPTRLRQVLVNLLSNAVKYNRPGGQVVVETEAVDEHTVRLAVTDTGTGLTPSQQMHLFEPFNRLGAERSSIEGTGLGLAITLRLVELMNGRISVHSQPGSGSTFGIELPRAQSPSAPTEVTAVNLVPAAADSTSHSVLYAEDNRLNIELVQQLLLLRSGCELRVAHNGREAIASARSHPPDLLLIDMHLGDMTGLDVLAALRNDAALAHVPRIALSADALPQNVRAARESGFDEYLTKPVDVAELLRCLDRHLAVKRPGR